MRSRREIQWLRLPPPNKRENWPQEEKVKVIYKEVYIAEEDE